LTTAALPCPVRRQRDLATTGLVFKPSQHRAGKKCSSCFSAAPWLWGECDKPRAAAPLRGGRPSGRPAPTAGGDHDGPGRGKDGGPPDGRRGRGRGGVDGGSRADPPPGVRGRTDPRRRRRIGQFPRTRGPRPGGRPGHRRGPIGAWKTCARSHGARKARVVASPRAGLAGSPGELQHPRSRGPRHPAPVPRQLLRPAEPRALCIGRRIGHPGKAPGNPETGCVGPKRGNASYRETWIRIPPGCRGAGGLLPQERREPCLH